MLGKYTGPMDGMGYDSLSFLGVWMLTFCKQLVPTMTSTSFLKNFLPDYLFFLQNLFI